MYPRLLRNYNGAMKFFHWSMGGCIMACIGFSHYYERLPKNTDEEKKLAGNFMMYHKSLGLIVSGLYLPRLVTRIVSKKPPVTKLKKVSHWGMYFLITATCF